MATPYTSIQAYLAAVPATHRAALDVLNGQIRRYCPEATEHISYGKPLYKWRGRPLVGFAAYKHHSAYFVWSSTVLGTLGDRLEGFDTAESTIRFPPAQELPEGLVKAVIDARIAEIARRGKSAD